ncbi:hypothetical protein FGG08_003856 [Glutinoglossum americanum]|uniref:Uncharacterized protein n=1 Tax=Glutinoglossum americanum TaxID=1670608 RepID=A0A9P8I3I1_9PEZI|nr:hypothetical protein FGG08_003856 [Glutinoglossum americanum]
MIGAEPGAHGPSIFVADDELGGAWQTVVEDVSDNADIRVHISSDNQGTIDMSDPGFAESGIECWQGKGGEAGDERTKVATESGMVWLVSVFVTGEGKGKSLSICESALAMPPEVSDHCPQQG